MKSAWRAAAWIALLLLPAQAGICGMVRIPLPGLAGPYQYSESRAETVSFTPPSTPPDSLWVHWTGWMYNGQGVADGNWIAWDGFIGIVELDSSSPYGGAHAGLVAIHGGHFDRNSPFVAGYGDDPSFLQDGRAAFRVAMSANWPEPFEPRVYPSCQLDSVEIVYRVAVAVESSTWGGVKSLYR